jgi:hypothetical protein
LPPVNAADCHLSIRLIAIFFILLWLMPHFIWSGLSASLPWPGCHCIYPAWVPCYFGLGAKLFIRPGCRCILSGLGATLPWPGSQFFHSAWVPLYLSGLSATLPRPECHITLAWVPVYSFGLSAT